MVTQSNFLQMKKPCKNQLTELSLILDFQERQRTLITQYANYIVFLQHLMRFKTLSAECSKDLAGEMQKKNCLQK